MSESLESALCGLDGNNLVTEEIAQLLSSIEENEIPECWDGVAYPTLDNLDEFVRDLVRIKRTIYLWQSILRIALALGQKSGVSADVARGGAPGGVLVDSPLRAGRLSHRHPLHREHGLRRTLSPTQTGDDYRLQSNLLPAVTWRVDAFKTRLPNIISPLLKKGM